MQEVNRPGVRWEWISEAWNLFTKQWSTWVVMILVMYLVIFAIYLPFFGMISLMIPTPEYGEPVEFPVAIFALYPVFYLVLLTAVSWFISGLYSAFTVCGFIDHSARSTGDPRRATCRCHSNVWAASRLGLSLLPKPTRSGATTRPPAARNTGIMRR